MWLRFQLREASRSSERIRPRAPMVQHALVDVAIIIPDISIANSGLDFCRKGRIGGVTGRLAGRRY